MALQLEKVLEETFSDPAHLSQEMIKRLLDEALDTFTTLQKMTRSTDPAEREKALKTADSLKQTIQSQMEAMSKMAGIEPTLFAQLSESAEHHAAKWLELSAAKQQIEALHTQSPPPQKKQSPKRNRAEWIPG